MTPTSARATPQHDRSMRSRAPGWGSTSTFVLAIVWALALPASAQPRPTKPASSPPATNPTKPGPITKPVKEQNFNFEGLGLNGRSRSPQLLYFLERANEELERASLEKRSFIPHMVRTVEEERL